MIPYVKDKVENRITIQKRVEFIQRIIEKITSTNIEKFFFQHSPVGYDFNIPGGIN
jgi:hypothetical protein